jgi:putative glutamine amidotransferase
MRRRVGVTYRSEEKVIPYERALRQAGLEPVRMSPDEPAKLEEVEGLVVTGGTDVDPARYGEAAHPETDRPDCERDAMEAELLQQALNRDMPVLAICRGMQLINVLHGGSLRQHIENADTHRVRTPQPELTAHTVEVEPGTKLAGIVGAGERGVNSRHHQAVERVGAGLRVSARAADGTIEAMEREDRRFVVAVQWHPEDRVFTSESDRKLFEAFAQALER